MHEQNSGPCGKGCHGSSVAPVGIVTASWLGIAKNNNTQGTWYWYKILATSQEGATRVALVPLPCF